MHGSFSLALPTLIRPVNFSRSRSLPLITRHERPVWRAMRWACWAIHMGVATLGGVWLRVRAKLAEVASPRPRDRPCAKVASPATSCRRVRLGAGVALPRNSSQTHASRPMLSPTALPAAAGSSLAAFRAPSSSKAALVSLAAASLRPTAARHAGCWRSHPRPCPGPPAALARSAGCGPWRPLAGAAVMKASVMEPASPVQSGRASAALTASLRPSPATRALVWAPRGAGWPFSPKKPKTTQGLAPFPIETLVNMWGECRGGGKKLSAG